MLTIPSSGVNQNKVLSAKSMESVLCFLSLSELRHSFNNCVQFAENKIDFVLANGVSQLSLLSFQIVSYRIITFL